MRNIRRAGAGAIRRGARGVALCRAAGARALAAVHHHPLHDDDALDAIDAALRAELPGSFVAREGQTLVLAPADAVAELAR